SAARGPPRRGTTGSSEAAISATATHQPSRRNTGDCTLAVPGAVVAAIDSARTGDLLAEVAHRGLEDGPAQLVEADAGGLGRHRHQRVRGHAGRGVQLE